MISDVPGVTPSSNPDIDPTEATVVVPLVHTPPDVALVNGVVEPTHTVVAPVIGAGEGFTVTTVVAKHPEPVRYVIVGDPAATPLTTPEPDPTEASKGLLLLQLPPVVASDKVVLCPTHTVPVPVITPGEELTVTGIVAIQPVGNV